MKFRKKPVVIEAHLWMENGDHPMDYAEDRSGFANGELVQFSGDHCKTNHWEGGVVRFYRRPDDPGTRECQHCGNIMHHHGWIDTLEGGHIVCPGDWIITGVRGERYPIKASIFEETYEAVTE